MAAPDRTRHLPMTRRSRRERPARLPSPRGEYLRTTLWLVPTTLVILAFLLFVLTFSIDQIVYNHHLVLPSWIRTESADEARDILIAIAAAVITVVGVVFSITILALTLASQQFGPRMMRNFIRNFGTQVTLGVWVATFAYSVLVLGSVTSTGPHGAFVPRVSVTVSEALLIVDLAVLIYFIHHIAKSIQLPEVIARIADDLTKAIDAEFPEAAEEGIFTSAELTDESVAQMLSCLEVSGVVIPATKSGYLQFVSYSQLVGIAEAADAVIRLAHRPGHFVVAGRPLATVWPPNVASQVGQALAETHATGPHRTLIQDPVFAIDQLVEIAIRALSPAVNDTFTALTCIDWLSAGLSRISGRKLSEGVYRDRLGNIRLIEFDPSYARMVNRAFDKVRQAARGMPAVVIRLMDSICYIIEYTVSPEQRRILLRQAEMILRASDEAVAEELDRAKVSQSYEEVVRVAALLDQGVRPRTSRVPGRMPTAGPVRANGAPASVRPSAAPVGTAGAAPRDSERQT